MTKIDAQDVRNNYIQIIQVYSVGNVKNYKMNSSECLLSILVDQTGGPDRAIERYNNEEVIEARRKLYVAKITGNKIV